MEYQKDLEIASHNFQSNQKWIRKLKSRKKKDLDHSFHDAHEEAFAEIDCLECANCCKTTSPIFIMADIERISSHLNVKLRDFMDQYLKLDEDHDYVLGSAPCPFLLPDNTCGIYNVRPRACREYPHTNRKRIHQILDLTLKNSMICPAVSRIFTILNRL